MKTVDEVRKRHEEKILMAVNEVVNNPTMSPTVKMTALVHSYGISRELAKALTERENRYE